MEILSSERCAPQFKAPRTSRLNPASANGIRFERRVDKALKILAINNGLLVESQPWFTYTIDDSKPNFCAPDFILSPLDFSWFIVIDAKQTFYRTAFDKLNLLYLSVVSKTYQKPVHGVLLCKTLIPGAPKPIDSLKQSLDFLSSVYHWPELGSSIVW